MAGSLPSWQLPTHSVSLFGKLPSTLDYVRVNHNYAAAIAFDEWLQHALQELVLANVSWSSRRYAFLFAPKGHDFALIGVVTASRDRAGRKFPVSVFAPLPVAALISDLALLPFACQRFFADVEALLDALNALPSADVSARIATLAPPRPEEFAAASAAALEALATHSADQFCTTLFPHGNAATAFAAALSTLLNHRDAPADRAAVLRCPAHEPNHVAVWLALAADVLRWRAATPSLFWNHADSAGRLFITLGPPPSVLPVWLADAPCKDPLITLPPTRLSARADQLLEKLVPVLAPGATQNLRDLLAQLTHSSLSAPA